MLFIKLLVLIAFRLGNIATIQLQNIGLRQAYEQWGVISRGTVSKLTVTYPLQYRNVYAILATYSDAASPQSEYAICTYDVNNTSFSVNFDPGGTATTEYAYWSSLGAQQWGEFSSSPVKFPVAFTSTSYVAFYSYFTNAAHGLYDGIHSYTATQFSCVMQEGNYPRKYLVIGKQQWGKLESSKVFTYPLTLNVLYTYHQEFYEGYIHWTTEAPSCEATLSTITTPDAPYPPAAMYFLVIGKQQWGVTAATTRYGYEVVAYPIAFTTAVYTVVQTFYNPNATNDQYASNYRGVGQVTNTTARIGYENSGSWIAVGKQQWGITTASNTATFPIAFPSSALACMISNNHEGSENWNDGYVSSFTLTKITCSHWSSIRFRWIAIGKQQWGRTSHSANQYARVSITFSLTFTTCYTCLAIPATTNTDGGSCTIGIGMNTPSTTGVKVVFTGGWGGHTSTGSYWIAVGA